MEYALSSKCPYQSHHRKPVEVRSRSGRRGAGRSRRRARRRSAVRKDNELNSAQRRNAKRLQEYLQLKGVRCARPGSRALLRLNERRRVEPAQAEPDVRNAEAAHCEAEATSRGQERAADESSAYEHQPSPHREQLPHTGASRPTHTQAPTVVDLATINKRQAERGGPRGSITCRFCGGRHQSSHRMPLCRCEQPGWYEHLRPGSPSWPQ